jgi:hypothetical protein
MRAAVVLTLITTCLAFALSACAQMVAPNQAQLDADAIMAGMEHQQQGAASVFSTSPQFPGAAGPAQPR